jgi:7-carboxy-7-deazaguanine synthase
VRRPPTLESVGQGVPAPRLCPPASRARPVSPQQGGNRIGGRGPQTRLGAASTDASLQNCGNPPRVLEGVRPPRGGGQNEPHWSSRKTRSRVSRLLAASVLKVNELFTSIQGEGPSAGEPALFLRLALCNLRCVWCDTRYTWDFTSYDYQIEVTPLSLEEVAERIGATGERRLVITGGEPLLQQALLVHLIALLNGAAIIEVETNGTLTPDPALAARVDQWNVSPKLEHSGNPRSRRWRPASLRTFRDTERAHLKFVVQELSDLTEVMTLVTEVAWPKERVLLMAQGSTRSEYEPRASVVEELCREHGFRFSPRLQVLLWDGQRSR